MLPGVRERTQRDPSNCKPCPDWNDAAGRCRLPVRERFGVCGSDAARHEAAGRRTSFDLYEDPVLAAAERSLRERADLEFFGVGKAV